MSEDDYQAGLRGETHYHGQLSQDYQRGLAKREGRTLSPSALAGSMGGAAAFGPGLIVLGATLYLSIIILVIASFIFPVGAGITLLAYLAFYQLTYNPMVNWLAYAIAFLVPGIFLFGASMQVEQAIAENRRYRFFRTVWRMIFGGLAGSFIAVQLTDPGPVIPEDLLWQMTFLFMQAVGIAVGAFIMRKISRRMDRSYEGMDTPLLPKVVRFLPLPKFPTPHFMEDDEEVKRRHEILSQRLSQMERAEVTSGDKFYKLRYQVADLEGLLEYRANKRAGQG